MILIYARTIEQCENFGVLRVLKSWDEPQYSIQNLGIEETYGFGVLNEGQAIAVAKNVRVRANEMGGPARPIISIGSDNPAYEAAANLVGANPIDVNADRFDLPQTGFVS